MWSAPRRQRRLASLLSLAAGLLVCLSALNPGVALVLLPLAGAGASPVVVLPASALVGPLLPDKLQASAFNLLMGLLAAAQVLATGVVGALADLVGTAIAMTVAALPAVVTGLWHLLPLSTSATTRLPRVSTSPSDVRWPPERLHTQRPLIGDRLLSNRLALLSACVWSLPREPRCSRCWSRTRTALPSCPDS